MTHSSLQRRALPLTCAAVATGSALASAPAPLATSTKVTYQGPMVDGRRGTVQAL